MSKYTVKVYTGDYRDRQEAANRDGAICYYEQHCNSLLYDDPATQKDNPVLGLVAHNASAISKAWAKAWAELVALKYHVPPPARLLQREKFKRGDYNLRFTKMPAMIGEPGFLSDRVQTVSLLSAEFRASIAKLTFEAIKEAFPDGGLIALSTGHLQDSKPFDRGAPITAPGIYIPKRRDGRPWAEWDISEDIIARVVEIIKASQQLRYSPNPSPKKPPQDSESFSCLCPHCEKKVILANA